jgi:hypothetical protein
MFLWTILNILKEIYIFKAVSNLFRLGRTASNKKCFSLPKGTSF